MAILLTLLLLGPDPAAVKVPELVAHLKSKKEDQALEILKQIGEMRGNHAEAKALVKVIRNRKLYRKLPKHAEIQEQAFLSLQGIGSRKVTRRVTALLDHSIMKKDPMVRIGVCRALEGSADPKAFEVVKDLLRDREDKVAAAAAEAAGAYRYAKVSIRKDLFKTVMDLYVSTWNLKNSVNPDLKKEKRRAEAKWEIIEKSMETTMQLLSNTTQNNPPAWRRWWNKNKHKKWEELEN